MNILNVMSWLWLTWSIKAKLLKMWIPEKEMEWVDFSNMNSLNSFAERIVPWLLRKNPNVAKQIKESWWLQWETKEKVDSIIEWL